MELVRDIERHAERLTERYTERYTRSRSLIACAQCGDRIFIPEWSEWLDGNRVRHLWQCETCDYAFETTVRFEAPVEA